jgi:hypothetical protein
MYVLRNLYTVVSDEMSELHDRAGATATAFIGGAA